MTILFYRKLLCEIGKCTTTNKSMLNTSSFAFMCWKKNVFLLLCGIFFSLSLVHLSFLWTIPSPNGDFKCKTVNGYKKNEVDTFLSNVSFFYECENWEYFPSYFTISRSVSFSTISSGSPLRSNELEKWHKSIATNKSILSYIYKYRMVFSSFFVRISYGAVWHSYMCIIL